MSAGALRRSGPGRSGDRLFAQRRFAAQGRHALLQLAARGVERVTQDDVDVLVAIAVGALHVDDDVLAQPALEPQPGHAEIEPTLATKWLRRATILPSLVAPTLKRCTCSRAPSSSASSRSSIHFTGLPPTSFFITQTSDSSGWPDIFRPKPPPTFGAITRI